MNRLNQRNQARPGTYHRIVVWLAAHAIHAYVTRPRGAKPPRTALDDFAKIYEKLTVFLDANFYSHAAEDSYQD